MRSDIQERASGRWYGILSALGVDSRFLRNKHGPCPSCGGRDRYRWDNKQGKGTFFCSQCGAGSGFDLLMKLKGWDFKQTAEEVEKIVGTIRRSQPRAEISPEQNRAAMRKRWSECRSVTSSEDPVAKYLKRRVGLETVPPVLRSASDRPAMVAIMQAPDGKATMVHTTFLTADGNKALMDKPRLMMPGTIAEGAAVRLAEPQDALGVAEGIETALAATALTGLPCWAALNRVLLSKWIVPAGVKRVVIFADNDAKYDGQLSAYSLANRISRSKDAPDVEVRIPPEIDTDWNDVLCEAMQNERA